MKLVSKTGEEVDVPDNQVQAAFQSGKYGLPAGSKLPMVGADSPIGYVTAENAAKAFRQGQRVASPEEVQKAHNEAHFGNASGQALAGFAGLARGATLGLSDPALIKGAGYLGGPALEEYTRSELQGVKEENPTLSGAGELAGAVAPFLIPGGQGAAGARVGAGAARLGAVEAAGAVARGATAIPRGVAAVGDLAGGAVTRALGEGVGARIAGTATSGAIQGAAASAGNEISESYLGNTELNGEKTLAAMGYGALLGGAAGGALHATGEVGSYVLGRLHPHLTGAAEEQAFRTINSRKLFTNEANRIPGGSRAIGRTLLDDGLIQAGDTVETMAPKIEAARAAAGENVGALLETADNAGIKGPMLGKIGTRIKEEVLQPLEKFGSLHPTAIAETQRALDSLATYAGSAAGGNGSGIGFRELQTFRRQMEARIKDFTAPTMGVPTKPSEALMQIRSILEDEIGHAGDLASKELGGGFSEAYKAAKLKAQRLIVADKAVQDALVRAQSNAAHSLTDKIMGAGALSAGMSGVLHMGHSLLSGGIGGLASAAIAGKISKLVRTQGNSTAAVLLDKAAALGGIRRAAAQVDRQIDRGVAGIFGKTERAAVSVKKTPLNYNQAVDQVSKAVGTAKQHTGIINGAVAPLAPHAPQTTNAFERAAIRATMFLASKIPPGHRRDDSLTPQLDRPRVSDMEKDRFLRYVQAVHDPAVVLEAMRNGSITDEHVEAIRTVYPELYAEIRTKISTRLADTKHPLPYAVEFRVRRLFGLPGMDGKMVALLQGNFNPAGASAGKGKRGRGGEAPALGALPHTPHAPLQPIQDAGKFARLSGLQPNVLK